VPKSRKIHSVHLSKPTLEGAGVHLRRAFGYNEVPTYDPFLLLDDFRSDNPDEYVEGFPWHPHRGIETITYMLIGTVEHGDSLGNKGMILSGDVQWMTAGSGIIHQEMPHGDEFGRMGGFQLWANLPAADKMMAPRYRDVRSEQIPVVKLPGGVEVRVIAGRVGETVGPVRDVVISPEYLDVTIPQGAEFSHPVPEGYTVFAYVIEGLGVFGSNRVEALNNSLVLFEDGDLLEVRADNEPVRFLLISGKPIGEPVAWYGPIVMNTNEELQIALNEYRNGTFIKSNPDNDLPKKD
jgi:quercetin 2,3-dioxygenase